MIGEFDLVDRDRARIRDDGVSCGYVKHCVPYYGPNDSGIAEQR